MISIKIVSIYNRPFENDKLPKHIKVKTLSDAKAFIKGWKKTYKGTDVIAKVYFSNKSINQIPNFDEISEKYENKPEFSKLIFWVSYYTLDLIEILDYFETEVNNVAFMSYIYDPFWEYFTDLKPEEYIYCFTDNKYYRFFDYPKYFKESCLEDPITIDLIDNTTIPGFDRGMPYYFFRKIYPAEKAMLEERYKDFDRESLK